MPLAEPRRPDSLLGRRTSSPRTKRLPKCESRSRSKWIPFLAAQHHSSLDRNNFKCSKMFVPTSSRALHAHVFGRIECRSTSFVAKKKGTETKASALAEYFSVSSQVAVVRDNGRLNCLLSQIPLQTSFNFIRSFARKGKADESFICISARRFDLPLSCSALVSWACTKFQYRNIPEINRSPICFMRDAVVIHLRRECTRNCNKLTIFPSGECLSFEFIVMNTIRVNIRIHFIRLKTRQQSV